MDPLAVIFLPGGTIFGVLLFGAPLAFLGFRWWRRRAHQRVAAACCGDCGQRFDWSQPQFLAAGVEICESCAKRMRRTLGFALPALAIGAGCFAISSGTAFAVSLATGGPSLAWWLDSRWIPLLTPSVGIAALTWVLIRFGKRANREADATPQLGRHSAELLPFPSAVIADARQRARVETDDLR